MKTSTLASLLCLTVVSATAKQKPIPEKKKIVILSCDGGGGHKSASNCLTSCLSDEYDLKVVNALDIVGSTIDPFRSLTNKRISGEGFYNYLLRNQWTSTTSLYMSIGKRAIDLQRRRIERRFDKFIAKENPDMLISVMPVVNSAAFAAAKTKDIPFLVITTDLDSHNYVNGMKKPRHEKFRFALAYDDPLLHEKIKKVDIEKKNLSYLGFPIRTDFFEKKDVAAIRKKYSLPRDRPIVLLMMGACGGAKMLAYAKLVLSFNKPVHLIAVTGNNKSLCKKINKVKSKQNSKTVLGFTRDISDLMAVSHLLISKPGPNTMCEALQMKLPMLLDDTAGHLRWEKLNLTFVQKNKLGTVIHKMGKVHDQLNRYLYNTKYRNEIKANIAKLTPNNFPENIKKLVHDLVPISSTAQTQAVQTT